MEVDPQNEKHLIADNGCILARITNLNETYNEVWLGKYKKSDGTIDDDKAENFIEIQNVISNQTNEEETEE